MIIFKSMEEKSLQPTKSGIERICKNCNKIIERHESHSKDDKKNHYCKNCK